MKRKIAYRLAMTYGSYCSYCFAAALLVTLLPQPAIAAEIAIPLAEAQDSVATADLTLFHEGVVSTAVEGSIEFVSPLRVPIGEGGTPRCAPYHAHSVVAGTFVFTPAGCAGERCSGVQFRLTFTPPTGRDLVFAHCNVEVAPNTPPGFYELPLRDARVLDADEHVVEARGASYGVSVPELPRHATIVIDTIEGRPGEMRHLDVILDTTVAARIERVGMTVVGDSQVRIPFDEETGDALCEVNPAIEKNDTEFYGSRFGGFSAEIRGTARHIPTGSRLFTCPVEIAENTPPGRYPLTCLRRDAYDTTDGFIATSCVAGAVNVLPGLPGTPPSTRIPTSSPEASVTSPSTTVRPPGSHGGCGISSPPGNGWCDVLMMVVPVAATVFRRGTSRKAR